ncbi:DNA repair protein RadC [Chlamydia trachomatis]|nr:DNA repair protein RadC [Chlamydia trachomatis]
MRHFKQRGFPYCQSSAPSGDPTPSMEDIEVTKRLAEAGKIIGIEVLDHLIVSHTGKYVSLKEKGYL